MRIRCTNCKEIFEVHENIKGKQVSCPYCQSLLKVPPPLRTESSDQQPLPPPLPKVNKDAKPLNSDVPEKNMKPPQEEYNSYNHSRETVKLALSIDFGSSRTKVAFFNQDTGRAELIELGREVRAIIPSVFYLPKGDGRILVGDDAQDMVDTDPKGVIINLKTEIHRPGKKRCGPGRKAMERVDIASELFRWIKKHCEDEVFYNQQIDSCILTVPVCFEDQKRECIRKAAELAGFTEISMMEEPIAAARYWLTTAMGDVPNKIIVCDIGGGTTDLAILQYKNGKFISYPKVPSSGIPQGGNDVDDKIWEEILSNNSDSENSRSRFAGFLLKIRKIKETLKKYAKKVIPLSVAGEEIGIPKEVIEKTIAEFVSTVQDEVKSFTQNCKQTIGYSNIPVLLVGGASRLNGLQQAVSEVVDGEVYLWKDSDYATVLGAACDESQLTPDESVTDDLIAKDIILCPKCELPNKKENKFCSSCGESLTKLCPECCYEVSIYANCCTSCGTDINNFIRLQELLPELKKLSELNKWQEIIDETNALPDRLLLKGEKGKKLLASLNNIIQGAEATIQKTKSLRSELDKKISELKFIDAQQLLTQLISLTSGSKTLDGLRLQLSSMAEFETFMNTTLDNIQSEFIQKNYIPILQHRKKIETYLENLNTSVKTYDWDIDFEKIQSRLDYISTFIDKAERNIKLFEQKYQEGKAAYNNNQATAHALLEEALSIYPYSDHSDEIRKLILKSKARQHEIISWVLIPAAIVLFILPLIIYGPEGFSSSFAIFLVIYACIFIYCEILYTIALSTNDAEKAFQYIKKNAKLTHIKSFYLLGVYYYEGYGVKKNIPLAIKWLKKSLKFNNKKAFFYLGECYEEQNSSDSDRKQAVKMYKKAAKQGNIEAKKRLKKMGY